MTSVKLKLNKTRALKDGNYPVVFQLIHQKRKKIIYTKYRMKEEDFIIIAGNVVSGCHTGCKISRELLRIYKQLTARVRRLESRGEEYTINDITTVMFSKATGKFLLLPYIDTQIEWKKSIMKNGTAAAYQSTYASLAKYIGKKEVKISQVNHRFVTCYRDFLSKNGATENTIGYYLRNFRALYNLAVKDGLVPPCDYPFKEICTKPCKTVKRALDREQMVKLACLSLHSDAELKRSLDLFLFGFYAQGMAFVDIVFLKKKNIRDGILSYRRHKSQQLIHIVVTPQMQGLIDKYANDSEYVFPIIDTSLSTSIYDQYRLALGRVNRYLKKITFRLNINVRLTTYTARHTWATLARESGAPISIISAGLGHTSEEMTRVYLKEFDQETLARVNRIVTNLL